MSELYLCPRGVLSCKLSAAKNELLQAIALADNAAAMCPKEFQNEEQDFKNLSRQMKDIQQKLDAYEKIIETTPAEFVEIDEEYAKKYGPGFKARFGTAFIKGIGLSTLLSGSYIGDAIKIGKDATKANDRESIGKLHKNASSYIRDVWEDAKDYSLVARMVGDDTSLKWWIKKVVGLRSAGNVSTAKEITTRFKNNLTNKSSPFNIKQGFKDEIDKLSGANGKGSAIAAWANVAVSGVLNFYDNKDEQEENRDKGKEMSDTRVVAETVTETAVDLALNIATKAVVGAAVCAIAGTAGAPAIVVSLASGVIVSGANALTEAIAGDSLTEIISDNIVDGLATKVSTAVGAVSTVSKSVGNWFKKVF